MRIIVSIFGKLRHLSRALYVILLLTLYSCGSNDISPIVDIPKPTIEDSVKVVYKPIIINVINAGNLSKSIATGKKDSIEQLKIVGSINGTDVKFIRTMAKLNYLDLSEANFMNGGEYYYSYYCFLYYDNGNYNVYRYEYVYTLSETINEYTFFKYPGLRKIILPNSAISIGTAALYGCSNLESITIGDNIETITNMTDNNGYSASNGWYALGGCPCLKEVTVSSKNKYFKSINGVLYKGNNTIILFPPNKDSIYTIPSNVNYIYDRAFCDAVKMGKIYCLNPVPPKLGNDVFKNVDKSKCILFVPKGSSNAYSYTGQWGDFTKIVEIMQ